MPYAHAAHVLHVAVVHPGVVDVAGVACVVHVSVVHDD
jgi:hypothetical protein